MSYPARVACRCLFLFLSAVSFTASAQAPAPLPQTGQTSCYSPEGGSIACAGTGQDGDVRAGEAWPSPRFTANGDCVSDSLTGLTWTRSNYPRIGIFSATWQQALSFTDGLSMCGYDDWRLPNVNEMESLYNAGVAFQPDWLRTQGFNYQDQSSGYTPVYWTSTQANFNQYYPNYVWVVDFGTGLVDVSTTLNWLDYNTKVSYPTTLSFWPVRGAGTGSTPVARTGQTLSYAAGDDGALQAGVSWPSPRFTASGDCISDNLTGLMWSRNANLPGQPMQWEDALAYVKELNQDASLCGLAGWRLPNRKELRSLANYSGVFSTWLADQGFANIMSGYGEWEPGSWWAAMYWTSTTVLGGGWWEPVMADVLGSYAGNLTNDLKFDRKQFVWPVRSAVATPPPATVHTLTVTKAGTGGGAVSSTPTGINCGADCSEPYSSGAVVTLTPTPASGSVFAGWSGDADCADGSVTLGANKACTATFNLSGAGAAGNADLALTLTASPNPVKVNTLLTYSLVVRNNGSVTATGVVLTDTLSSKVVLVSAIAAQGSCSGAPLVTCSLGSLASGAQATVTLVTRPVKADDIGNKAQVTASQQDLNTGNNKRQSTVKSIP